MNIEKWIEDNSQELVDFDACNVDDVISADKLRELLKTHAIVPREPTDDFCRAVSKQSCQYVSDMQIKTMIEFIVKAAENEQ